MTTENNHNKRLEAFCYFKIEVIADFEFEGKIIKNYPHYNNDSIITSKNWEQNKNTFFDQRMQTYDETFTLAEKINLEIENLEALTTNENEYKILKNRYSEFLKKSITDDAEGKLTFLDFIHNVKDKELFADDLKESFKIETNTEIAIVIQLLDINQIFVYSYFADIYRELKKYFEREIGKQNTINDAVKRIKEGKQTRTKSFDSISGKVNTLIDKHKIKLNSYK